MAARAGRRKRELDPAVRHIAAGYVRESTSMQELGVSPEVQRERLRELAARHGLVIPEDRWRQETERGRVDQRPAYQEILEWARRGEIGAVLVFTLSRWGRRTAERIRSRDELHERGQRLISYVQGEDVPGLASDVNAAVDEEYSRMLARTTRPNKEYRARQGVSMGPTPYGYTRVYPAYEGKRKPWGLLTPDPVTAPIVRERIFSRYATGEVSLRQLARELNADPAVPKPRDAQHPYRAARFSSDGLRDMLRRVTYVGLIGYNERTTGVYDAAEPGSYFEVPGRHEAIVERAVWDRVQALLRRNADRPGLVRGGRKAHLLTGLLRCHVCGGPMVYLLVPADGSGRCSRYVCRETNHGQAACRGAGYVAPLAHRAVLAEVARLEFMPWTRQTEERLDRRAGRGQGEVERVRRELAAERVRLEQHGQGLALLGALTPQEVGAFGSVARAISDRIVALEARLAELERDVARVEPLRLRHARLAGVLRPRELAAILADPELDVEADPEALALVRALLKEVVETAVLAERERPRTARWLRFAVTWTADVRLMLECGAARYRVDG